MKLLYSIIIMCHMTHAAHHPITHPRHQYIFDKTSQEAAHQLRIGQIKHLIAQSTSLPDVLINIIIDYTPTVLPQWLPIIDNNNPQYQHQKILAQVPIFYYLEPQKNNLSMTALFATSEKSPDYDILQDDSAHLRQTYGEELLVSLTEKIRTPQSAHIDTAYVLWEHSNSQYGVSADILPCFTYILNHCQLQLAATDSSVCTEAVQRSTLLFSPYITWNDLGRYMTLLYKKSKSLVPYMNETGEAAGIIQEYITAYEHAGHIPRKLKKLSTESHMRPVFYRKNSSKKRKRSLSE